MGFMLLCVKIDKEIGLCGFRECRISPEGPAWHCSPEMSAKNDLSVCTTVSSLSGCLRGLLCFSLQQRAKQGLRPTAKQRQAPRTVAACAQS